MGKVSQWVGLFGVQSELQGLGKKRTSRSSKHGERGSELLLLLLWSVVYILFARARVGGTGDNITGQLL